MEADVVTKCANIQLVKDNVLLFSITSFLLRLTRRANCLLFKIFGG